MELYIAIRISVPNAGVPHIPRKAPRVWAAFASVLGTDTGALPYGSQPLVRLPTGGFVHQCESVCFSKSSWLGHIQSNNFLRELLRFLHGPCCASGRLPAWLGDRRVGDWGAGEFAAVSDIVIFAILASRKFHKTACIRLASGIPRYTEMLGLWRRLERLGQVSILGQHLICDA